MPENPSHFVSVVVGDGNGPDQHYPCPEEPIMLSPSQGFGFFNLGVGAKLNQGKYDIVRKLGWGGYSNVWLAKSTRSVQSSGHFFALKLYPDSALPNNRLFFAIKIMTTLTTMGIGGNVLPGPAAYHRIAEANPHHIGYKHCQIIRDSFETKGFHGLHTCIVTDPLGSNLWALRRAQPSRVFSIEAAKSITRQTLLALDYLHRDCKYVHTGK
jgi:serine/threonine-protein kinase SRPK3